MKSKFAGLFVFSMAIAVTLLAAGCSITHKKESRVSVFGVGTVLTPPDTIQMAVSLSKTARTSQEAREEVSGMVRQALKILKDFGIEDKNISTASLRLNAEYEWGGNRRVLLGQKAEQVITFSINNIANNDEKTSAVIDRLIQINGLELNQMSFGVKDTAGYFAKSRELAYQKALEKAAQYAELSGLMIVKTLSISEEGNPQIAPVSGRLSNQMKLNLGEADAAADSGELPAGELEITSRILVEFLLDKVYTEPGQTPEY